MRFRDRRIKNMGDLLRALGSQNEENATIWFRGQSNAKWPLVPSIGRDKSHIPAELQLCKRFKQNAVSHLTTRPDSEWEWMFLMQHHRLPTRLLDWTESPLAAMFFALDSDRKSDSAIWCLDPVALNRNSNIDFDYQLEIAAFDQDEVLDNYLPATIAKERTTDLAPVAGIASRSSPRLTAQVGAFTITHRRFTPVEEVGDRKHVWRLVIPKDAKPTLRRELKLLRYTNLSMFPELDNVAEEAKEILL